MPSVDSVARSSAAVAKPKRYTPIVTLVEPGGELYCSQPNVSHDVVKSPSVVAPSVSRARKANTVARSSSGNTNAIRIIPPCFCSASGIQASAWQPRMSMPIPNEKKPRGNALPTGRRKIVVCECGGVSIA